MIDVLTGMQAHGAILAALLRRGITGEGQHVDVCLLDTQVPWKVLMLHAACLPLLTCMM